MMDDKVLIESQVKWFEKGYSAGVNQVMSTSFYIAISGRNKEEILERLKQAFEDITTVQEPSLMAVV